MVAVMVFLHRNSGMEENTSCHGCDFVDALDISDLLRSSDVLIQAEEAAKACRSCLKHLPWSQKEGRCRSGRNCF